MSDALKTVATFTMPIEADMAKNRLEAEGIRAFLGDAAMAGWCWHLTNAMHGVAILVAERDLARAVEILEDDADQPTEESAPWSCPKCGAEVEGNLAACWACGTAPDGTIDPGFESSLSETQAGEPTWKVAAEMALPAGDADQDEFDPLLPVARRACVAALFGVAASYFVLFDVFTFYSVWLILRYELYRRDTCRGARWLVNTAIVLDAIALMVMATFTYLVF